MGEGTETLTDKVEAEAARAEAEEPSEPETHPDEAAEEEAAEAEGGESEPSGPGESEPAPEASVSPKSERDIEQMFQKLGREAERHDKRVAEILGDDYEAQAPWALTFPPQIYFRAGVGPLFEEHRDAVFAILGKEAEPQFQEADDAVQCETCMGRGQTLTGSLVPEQRTKLCRVCNGAGWNPKGGTQPSNVVQLPAGEANGEAQAPEATVNIPDAWGRPPGHPQWGQSPKFDPATGGFR